MSFFAAVGSLLGWGQGSTQSSVAFTPGYKDICEVRAILRFLKLPDELVLVILEQADYWPQHTFATNPDERKHASATYERPSHACLCLDAGIFDNHTVTPIRKGGETPKIKALSFEIDSYDQGFTSENTRDTFSTSSWIEVSILRSVDANNTRLPGPRFVNTWISNPSDFHRGVSNGWFLVKRPEEEEVGPQWGENHFAWYLQGNRVTSPCSTYRVMWSDEGFDGNEGAGNGHGFLEELNNGGRLLVWARARYPAWKCFVEHVKVTVHYRF